MTLETNQEGVIVSRFTKENIQEIVIGILSEGYDPFKSFLYKEIRLALKSIELSEISLREHQIINEVISTVVLKNVKEIPDDE